MKPWVPLGRNLQQSWRKPFAPAGHTIQPMVKPQILHPAGYADGSGVVRGLGRGLAGAVGLPVSGALAAISALSAGLAAATGVSPIAVVHRPVPDPG